MLCIDLFKNINYTELIAGGIIGGVIGLGVSELKEYLACRYHKRELKNRYKPMCGQYRRAINENEYAETVIEYKHGSILEINTKTYTGEIMQEHWQGEIKMDTTLQGLIVWHHEYPKALDRNGFKRIIVNADQKKITLLGESEYGYGVEELKKVE